MSSKKPELVLLPSPIEAIAGVCRKPQCTATDQPINNATVAAYEADE